MSRHGYSDGDDEPYPGAWALYARRVANAIRGKRGQQFLREMVEALDAMPVKELAARTAVSGDGAKCCALGAVAVRRNLDVSPILYTEADDEEDDGTWTTEWLRDALGLTDALAREVVYQNDEGGRSYHGGESDAERWQRMRSWAAARLTGGA